jgi:hypothetical protein
MMMMLTVILKILTQTFCADILAILNDTLRKLSKN